MPLAARVTDMTGHGPPLTPGIGSPNVFIGGMPTWRALPAGVGGAVESVSNAMQSFMGLPMLTPASAADKIAQIQSGLFQAAGAAAAQGNPAAVGAAASASVTLISTNVALTATWTAASALPGGQPAANIAYIEGIKHGAAAVAETEDVIQKVEAIENAFSKAAINGLPLIDRSQDCPFKEYE